ncbi:MAG: flagellar hook-length control protein FliK [Pseudomonadota bacterium]
MSESLAQNVPALADFFAGRAAAAGASSQSQAGPKQSESSTGFSDLLTNKPRTLPGDEASGGGVLIAEVDPQQPVLVTPFWPGTSGGQPMAPPSVTGHAERIAVDNRLINGLANGTLVSAGENGPRIETLATNFRSLPSEAGTAIQGPGTGQAPATGPTLGAGDDASPLLLTTLSAEAGQPKPLVEETTLPLPGSLTRSTTAASVQPAVPTNAGPGGSSEKPGRTGPLIDSQSGSGLLANQTHSTTTQTSVKAPEGQPLAGFQPNASASLFAATTLGAASAIGDGLFTLRRGAVELTGNPPPAPASSVNPTATPAVNTAPAELSTALSTDRSNVQTTPVVQVADQVKMMVKGEQREAQLQLHPRELGAVNIRIALNADQASVSIEASNPDLYRELSSALPRLRQLFMEEGMGMAQLALDMGQSQQQEQQALAQEAQLTGPSTPEQSPNAVEAAAPVIVRKNPDDERSLDLYA